MESQSGVVEVSFAILHARLIAYVNCRIQNGEFSERALAKHLGISQPHLHNVLKGSRKLQVTLADAMLARFQISALDLISRGEFVGHDEAKSKGTGTGEAERLRLLRKQPASAVARSAKREPWYSADEDARSTA